MSAIRTSLSILLGAVLGFAAVHAASPLASGTVSRADHAAAQKSAQDADIIRSLLVGEFAVQSGDSELAWKAFLTAAQKGRSAEAAGRAFDIAQEADNEEAADQALKVWTELDPNNRQVRLIKAEELFSQGKYDEAGELVKGLVQAARDPAGALDELGGMQQVAPAKDLFYHAFVKAAVDLKEDARAQLVLSELANRARMTPQAAMHASKAMDLAPDSPHVLMKGIDAEFQNDPKKAMKRLEDYLTRHPDSFELRLAYAKSLLRTGNGKKLDEQLKRLEEGRRDDAHSMMLLGMIAEEARLYERAELYYKRYLVLLSKAEKTALLPDTAYVRLGMVKLAQGHRELAVEWLDKVEEGDKYQAARIKQVEILAELRRVDDACRVLSNIRARDAKQKSSFLRSCAGLLLNSGRKNETIDVLLKAIEATPNDVELIYQTAMTAHQAERFADSEKLLKRFIKLAPDNPNGYNSLGYMWLERNEHLPQAEELIEKAMKLTDGKDPYVTDSLGWLRYRQGNLEEAEKLLAKAQNLEPADTEIALHLAEVLYVRGKNKEARAVISSILEGEPKNAKALQLRQKFEGTKPAAPSKAKAH